MPKIMSAVVSKPKTTIALALVAAGAAVIGTLIKRSLTAAINDDPSQSAAA